MKLLPPGETPGYAAALVASRHSPLAEALLCSRRVDECDGEAGVASQAAAQATPEETEVAERVATLLNPHPDGILDGVTHILLGDYLEHVVGYAVGMRGLCGFLTHCLR